MALATSRITQAWASKRSGCLHLPALSGKRWTTHVQALPAWKKGKTMADRRPLAGKIVALWCSPIKSMPCLELHATTIVNGSLLGDPH